MLKYSSYYTALSVLHAPKSVEWRSTFAGLVVLRLIDDWLDFGLPVVTPETLTRVTDILAQVPETEPVRSILQRISHAIVSAPTPSIHSIQRPLLGYAEHMYLEAHYAHEEDILLEVIARATKSRNMELLVHASRQLAMVQNKLCRFVDAEETYLPTIHYGRKVGDVQNVLLAQMSHAKTINTLGDAARAESIFATLTKRAERLQVPRLITAACLDQAYLLFLREEARSSKRFLQKALRYADSATDKYLALAQLAAILATEQHFAPAKKINIELAVSSPDRWTRYQATINLMCTAIEERCAEDFYLYRSAISIVKLAPMLEVWYQYYAARGRRTFGDRYTAQKGFARAQILARQYDFPKNGVFKALWEPLN